MGVTEESNGGGRIKCVNIFRITPGTWAGIIRTGCDYLPPHTLSASPELITAHWFYLLTYLVEFIGARVVNTFIQCVGFRRTIL